VSGTFRSATLSNYVEVARQVGVDPYQMLRRVGIDAHVLNDPNMPLSARQVARLLEASAEASGCPDFGMRMAEARRISDLGVVSLLILHLATLRDVLDTTVRYRNLLNSALALHVEETGDVVEVKEELVVDFDGPAIQCYELAIGILVRVFRSILGVKWQPVSVHFSHPRPARAHLHRKLLGERVEFGSEFNGLTCLKTDLDHPNASADPNLARYAAQFIDSLHDVGDTSLSYEVRKSIYLLMPMGGATVPRISRSLGLSERTMQRRLANEGAEFSELVNGVRRELTERYLANASYSLTRIAEMLGYGQLSSFTRWFVSEFGVSPSLWRDRKNTSPEDQANIENELGEICHDSQA
jgi:AraC-like DNA-binding protein